MFKVYFATSNKGKFLEVKRLAEAFSLQVEQAPIKGVEIQHESLAEIASQAVRQAYRKLKAPVMVEDAGLFIEALNGFPGPYSSYVYRKLGVQGILKLMEGERNRRAWFLSALAFKAPKMKVKVFLGRVDGEIVLQARGRKGFGFDPIFQPEGEKRTFAEMEPEEKNRFSHRGKALAELAEWLKKRGYI
ncbi:non-canonical purine NTP pyrophosphatase, RdgB/HAM1 family [Candidatus Bathyarchaeota archaeon]|nr:MAG: non-canonical purine NTP pyrophosphatase, RdgB/HAM1 family [Candidatus Hecatellales archaeon]RLI34762.1 MAG: non-canonical purine NTP pyrophosphatase, RdgB/HAM1 family [Candidatus Bathyarchaeota archaeon]